MDKKVKKAFNIELKKGFVLDGVNSDDQDEDNNVKMSIKRGYI